MDCITIDSACTGELMEVSLAKCMDDPLSCSACVDEMRETASTIKTEVLAELNATRKRLRQMTSDFVGLQHPDDSG